MVSAIRWYELNILRNATLARSCDRPSKIHDHAKSQHCRVRHTRVPANIPVILKHRLAHEVRLQVSRIVQFDCFLRSEHRGSKRYVDWAKRVSSLRVDETKRDGVAGAA